MCKGIRRQCAWTGAREGGEMTADEAGEVVVGTDQTVRPGTRKTVFHGKLGNLDFIVKSNKMYGGGYQEQSNV